MGKPTGGERGDYPPPRLDVTVTRDFQHFQYFNYEFSEKLKLS